MMFPGLTCVPLDSLYRLEEGMGIPHYDVVTIGGGTAGVVAAVQSAHVGVRTLLVEKNGTLGGTVTSAGVDFPGLFHAAGRQVIAGIGWGLVSRCVAECGGALPDFTRAGPHWTHQVRVNRAIFAALCDEALISAGADVLLHAMPAAVRETDAGWRVTLCTKTGLREVLAHVLIDATGDANVISLAGGPVRTHAQTQPATLICRATGYSLADLDLEAINRRAESAVQSGQLDVVGVSRNMFRINVRPWLQRGGDNVGHVPAPDAQTSEGRTQLELVARRSLLRLFRFLRTQPGLEGLQIEFLASECGVRETAVIRGDETVSGEDYVTGRAWRDPVCYSYYPIDLHTDEGLDCRSLPEGVVPSVPRGALLPKGTRNLLAAGRCISSDREANSALRVQATCMAVGQAAGALAALAAKGGQECRAVPQASLRQVLEAHGAIVPPGV